MTTVIGFLTYKDFLTEVQDAGVKTVRLQDYYRQRDGGNGLPWTDFYIELAATQNDEVYVCRFRIGGGPDMEMDQPRRQRDQDNSEKAMGILRQDMEDKGFQVRPGIMAATGESKTTSTGPWRYERDEQGLPVLVADSRLK